MFWNSNSNFNKKYQRRQRVIEALENRCLMAANIASWIDTSGGVLYVAGGSTSDNIQVRFENGKVGVRDGATNQIVKISVTDHGTVTQRDSIARSMVPYFVQVSTGEGINAVNVVEDSTNLALPLQIYGGQSNDTLNGGSANDTIYGLGGNDTINGNAGDDYMVGGYGLTTEAVPSQGDAISGGFGNDTLIGGNGNDLLNGGQGDDSLVGLNGNDTLTGGLGLNGYDGGSGTDLIAESELYDASITDGRLTMTRFDGIWNQTSVSITSIEMANLTTAANATTGVMLDASLFSGRAVLTGGPKNDVLKGGRGNDQLYGLAGDDTLSGGIGDNTLCGNAGSDTISETSVANASLTNSQFVVIFLGLTTESSNALSEIEKATITTSALENSWGAWIDAKSFTGFTTFTGTDSEDHFIVGSGGSFVRTLGGSDIIEGGQGNDDLDSGAGDDVIFGGTGTDILRGGTGLDSLSETSLSYAVLSNASLTTRYVKFSLSGSKQFVYEVDTLSGFENAELSAQPVAVLLGINGSILDASGFSGVVKLYGNNGDDRLSGGSSADTLLGGLGNDRLIGNGGGDFIYGEGGADTIWGDQDFRGIEDGADTISGGDGNDTIYGGGGDDAIRGEAQNDALYGDLIGDNLFDGRDQLFGGEGTDTLWGGGGNDLLYGGAFTDVDVLNGGAGADVFLAMFGEDNAVDYRVNSDDARIRFSADARKTWRDDEVLSIIPGLKFLADQTGNTKLLKNSNGGELEIQRVTSLPAYLGLTVDAFNDGTGKISFANGAFTGSSTAALMVHEMAHNWNNASSVQWLRLSGWQPHDPTKLNSPSGFQRSNDMAWDYLSTASFDSDYGRSNPNEDWATCWEAYYANKNGSLSAGNQASLQTKLNYIDQFFKSMR